MHSSISKCVRGEHDGRDCRFVIAALNRNGGLPTWSRFMVADNEVFGV